MQRRLVFYCLLVFGKLICAEQQHNETENAMKMASNLSSVQLERGETLVMECENGSDVSMCSENTETEEPSLQETFISIEKFIQKYIIMTMTIVGAFGCIVTLIVLHRGALEKTSASVYIRGITASNCVMVFISVLSTLNRYEGLAQNTNWQTVYAFHFAYINRLTYVAMSANVWTNTAFALDRFMAIYYPLKAHIVSSESKSKKIVIAIYIAAVLTNITRFFVFKVTPRTNPVTNETVHAWEFTELGLSPIYNKIAAIFHIVVAIAVPIPLLATFNVLIIRKLRSAHDEQKNLTEGSDRKLDTEKEFRRVQIQRVLFASSFSFLLCNVLISGIMIILVIYPRSYLLEFHLDVKLLFLLSAILYVLNPSMNFLLYVCCSQVLRDAAKEILCWRKFTAQYSSSSLSTATTHPGA